MFSSKEVAAYSDMDVEKMTLLRVNSLYDWKKRPVIESFFKLCSKSFMSLYIDWYFVIPNHNQDIWNVKVGNADVQNSDLVFILDGLPKKHSNFFTTGRERRRSWGARL